MDSQTLINTGLGALLAIFGWLARQLWEAVSKLREDLHNIEKDLPKSYVSKDEFNITMKRIEDMVERIYDKLDAKADKRS